MRSSQADCYLTSGSSSKKSFCWSRFIGVVIKRLVGLISAYKGSVVVNDGGDEERCVDGRK
jgi:hypothetical protein